jgi:high-affinity iron transporter
MLPTFVIGLREGLEAALIVGIIAAFLNQRGRRDLLVRMWLGIGLAVLLCLGVGVGLHIVSADLPQKQQEGLETVVGAIAVLMVTYMVVWMRRHSRDLKKQLEGAADSALASGSGMALVAMAFLAVFREGFETAVFLLAAFNNAASPADAGGGALLGLAVAVVLGYGIYRGGVRINLSKFFRFTGFVLVLVAAGLVVSAFHTAHEAGWVNFGQSRTVDLTWLVKPGSVQSSLLTGILGLQPRPVVIEVVAWLAYLIPVGLYVAWPPGRSAPHRAVLRIGSTLAALGVVAAVVLTFTMPAAVKAPGTTTLATNGEPLTFTNVRAGATQLSTTLVRAGQASQWTLTSSDGQTLDGRALNGYRKDGQTVANPTGLPTSMALADVVKSNGGRLPLGASTATEKPVVPVTYTSAASLSVGVDADTGRVVTAMLRTDTTIVATLSIGSTPVGTIKSTTEQATAAVAAAAAKNAAHADQNQDRRDLMSSYRLAAILVAVFAALAAATSALALRRKPVDAEVVAEDTKKSSPTKAIVS